jgi:hypothetical protein
MHRYALLRGGALAAFVAAVAVCGLARAEGEAFVMPDVHWEPCAGTAEGFECELARVRFDYGGRVLVLELARFAVGLDEGDPSAMAAPVVVVRSYIDEAAIEVGVEGNEASEASEASEGGLFEDPSPEYTPPTYERCIGELVIRYRVEGVFPPEGSVCDADP